MITDNRFSWSAITITTDTIYMSVLTLTNYASVYLQKDGFLTPATPDIPRQSVHRDPRAKHHDSGEMGSEDVKLPHGENPVECNQSG